MKVKILKRLEKLERQILEREEFPLLVTLSHEPQKGWRIGETYTSRQKSYRVKRLGEYTIEPGMQDTTFILDEIGDNGGLFSFTGKEVLEKVTRGAGVSIEGLEVSENELISTMIISETMEVN